MEKLLAELAQAIKALHEDISKRFSPADPAAAKAETDALVARVQSLEKQIKKEKAEQKMVFLVGDKKAGDGERGVGMAGFLRAVKYGDDEILKGIEEKAASGQSETDADGGYAVPEDFSTEIIRLEQQASIIRRIARIFPFGTAPVRNLPKQLAKPSIYWVDEAASITKSKATLDRVIQTAKKVATIIPFTNEVLADNNASFDQFVFALVAEVMALEDDKQAFVGNGSPFTGVFNHGDVIDVDLAGADLGFADLISLQMAVKAPYRARGRYVLSTTGLSKAMKLVDDQGRPIWNSPATGAPGTICGKPYEESDQIPDTLGTGAQTGVAFGAWDQVYVSDKGGYRVDASNSATDGTNHAFLKDETWYRFIRRIAITVANGEALSRLFF
jgi:HK97 family phage major capsid protein